MTDKWEYKLLLVEEPKNRGYTNFQWGNSELALNRMGQEGWEHYANAFDPHPSVRCHVYYLKRKISS